MKGKILGIIALLFIPVVSYGSRVGNLYASPSAVWDISEVELYPPFGAVSTFPSTPSTGAMKIVTDSNGVDCTGGGADLAICIYNGTNWVLPYAQRVDTANVTVIVSVNCSAETGPEGSFCFEVLP